MLLWNVASEDLAVDISLVEVVPFFACTKSDTPNLVFGYSNLLSERM